jgi:hypothetical protein
MGYRSTVAYTIRFVPIVKEHEGIDYETAIEKAKASFYTFLAEAKSKEDTALCFSAEESDYFKVNEDDLQICFFVENVKWYDDYPEVKCHEALMDLSREWADDGDCSNPCIGGAFARVGEEMDDNTNDVWGQADYDWVGINRSVYADWVN